MSRLSDDACAIQVSLQQSVKPQDYMLDPIKFEHCNACRHEFGLYPGNDVSLNAASLVDIENNLRIADRPNSHCPNMKWNPPTGHYIQGKEDIKPVQHPLLDTSMQHLKSCQMISYAPAVPEPARPMYTCTPRRSD
jgi:hypothetical protein